MRNQEKAKHQFDFPDELQFLFAGIEEDNAADPTNTGSGKKKNRRPIGDDGELTTPELSWQQERALHIIGVDCNKYRATLYWWRRTMETIATTAVITRLAVPENTAFFLSIVAVFAVVAYIVLAERVHKINDKFSAVYSQENKGAIAAIYKRKSEIISALVELGLSEQFVRSHFGTITKIFRDRERGLQAQAAIEQHRKETRQRLGFVDDEPEEANQYDDEDDDLESAEERRQRLEVLKRLGETGIAESQARRAWLVHQSHLPPVDRAKHATLPPTPRPMSRTIPPPTLSKPRQKSK